MPDVADVLERESRTVDLEPGDFERLLGRRERKERNRRIRAGVVAVGVALAVGFILFRSLTPRSIPAHPPVTPKPAPTRGAGEVLTGGFALDPDSGQRRMIVDESALPSGARAITAAAWSSDREWVAFRGSPGGSQDGSIWVADTVGGAPRQVAKDGRWSPWVWSPTRDQLAVVQGRHVMLVDAATGRKTDLGSTAVTKDWVQALVWSPDGSRIAYSGGLGGGSVHSIDVESGEHSVLVPQPAGAGSVIDIDWSPDGDHLAITYEDTSRRIDGKFRHPLYLANADGSETRLVDRNVAGGTWPDWHPGLSGVGTAWSPDGTRLAYTSISGRGEIQVWTVPANGSAPSLVTSHCCVSDGGAPVWSPDGSQIAFIAEVGNDLPLDQLRHYMVVNADGTGGLREINDLRYRSWDGGWYFCFCYG